MAGESEVVQVQLTEDGTRPVDLPEQYATIQDMANSMKEAQATITRLSQPTEETTPKATPVAKKADEALPPAVASALESIALFTESQRQVRFTGIVGEEGLAALNSYLSGDAIPANLKASYEAAIDTGDEALIDANFNMIRQDFEVKHGSFDTPKNMVAGIAGGGIIIPTGTKPFRSLEEQLTAQRDPKYTSDPAFRKDVENRIAISPTYEA